MTRTRGRLRHHLRALPSRPPPLTAAGVPPQTGLGLSSGCLRQSSLVSAVGIAQWFTSWRLGSISLRVSMPRSRSRRPTTLRAVPSSSISRCPTETQPDGPAVADPGVPNATPSWRVGGRLAELRAAKLASTHMNGSSGPPAQIGLGFQRPPGLGVQRPECAAVCGGERRGLPDVIPDLELFAKAHEVGDEVTTILERVHNVRESTGMGEPKRMA